MTGVDVAERIGQQYKQHGGYVVTTCYNTSGHSQGDRKPSLTIYDGEKGYYCYACGESGTHSWLLRQFGIDDGSFKPRYKKYSNPTPKAAPKPAPKKDYKTYPLDEIYAKLDDLPPQATEILDRKGFDWKHWENVAGWKWHTNEIPGWPAGIFIPYFKDGTIVTARLRALEGNVRFFSLPGGESFGYLMDNLHKPRVYVTEGESDCLTMHFVGIPAVGIPGSTNAEAIRKVVEMAKSTGAKLVVVPDNDEAGAKFADRIRAEAFDQRVPCEEFTVPGFKDVNDWFVAVGQEAFERTMTNSMRDDAFAELPPKLEQGRLAI